MPSSSPPALLHSSDAEGLRNYTKFHPSIWGDFFLTYQPPTAPQSESMKERAGVLREKVREILKSPKELPETLNLIITLQRLGLDSYYESEIDELLHGVYNSDCYDEKDLNLVSLRFYLLRKNGYNVSSDVFLKFITKDGNFVDADTRSLLSLYNAAYLRTRDEKVLDEAISYTTCRLQDALQYLKSPLATEVSSSLDIPLFKKVGIIEARNYIPIYEKESTRNEVVLKFAKLNFNLQQLDFCQEIKECMMWWKDIHAKSKLSFVRDRIVELYFWMNNACYYPTCSLSRIVLTKTTAIVTILDDIFDTYGTNEECMQIAEAIYRWDESAVHLLPEYVKGFYLCLLETFISFEDELGPEKSYLVFYLKERMKHLVHLYCKELKWREENYVPSMSEHLQVTMESVGSAALTCAAFVGMGDIITKEVFEWILSYPQFFKSFAIFVRLANDLVSTQREQTGDHSPSSIQCYMKEHGTTMQDAYKKIKQLSEDSWKDMIQGSLVLEDQPKVVPRTVLDLSRTAVYMYKQCDAFTTSEILQEMIKLLFVEPIPE
ncbi:hypothetical protein SETIT_6G048400v2 [Setaria italica]|uniref:Terpene synthase TPS14 n=1 Tax=Setaria italica TaxID=4555 RepID=A0A368RI33_SETIT|nr:sesquithujene synthase A [Setaria italica]QJA42346.1 terpene synthase TPS14 [Setaria italica]RCV29876.1 hypothetical protein SETIT_6G048400v2 [Setaria italica]